MPDFQSKSHKAWWRKQECREQASALEAEGTHAETTLLVITLIKWQRRPRGARDFSIQTQTDAISGNQWPLSMGLFIFGNDQLINFTCEREGKKYIYIFSNTRGSGILQKHLQIGQGYSLWSGAFGFSYLKWPKLFSSGFFFCMEAFLCQFCSWGVKCSIGCLDLTPIHFSFLGEKKLIFGRHECQLLLFCN